MNRRVDLLKALKLLALIIVLFICFTGVISWKLENKAEGSTLSNLVKRVEDTSVLTSASKAKGNDLILVNKQNFLENDYVPENLVRPNIPFLEDCTEEEMQLQKHAAKALERLVNAAKDENITLIGSSGYRSYQTQVEVYNSYCKKKGKSYTLQYVASPGSSEHQTGLAIDITNSSRCFDKNSKEAKWLADNAYKYGFILRYLEGKIDITGYNYEPWHIRYVGKKVAKEIYNNSETLEEYLERLG